MDIVVLSVRSSAKGDNAYSIDCVRFARKTGRWLSLAPERPLYPVQLAGLDPLQAYKPRPALRLKPAVEPASKH